MFGLGLSPTKKAVRHTPVWFFMPVWALVTGAVFWLSVKLAYENHLFADHAQHTRARIVQKFEKECHGKHGTYYVPYIGYEYETGNMRFRCSMEMQRNDWNRANLGDLFPVKYLPERPLDNRIDLPKADQIAVEKAFGGIGFGVFLLLVGIAGFNYLIKRNKLYAQLIREGVSCLGEVLSVEEVRGGKGQIYKYLKIKFTDQMGHEVEGKTWYLNRNQTRYWQRGVSIKVFYDRSNSEIFTVDLDDKPSSEK